MFGPLPRGALIGALLLAAALLVLPLLVRGSYALHLLILSMIYACFALGWNLVAGYGGLKTFGHQAFFGIGAYASALLAMRTGLSPWITMWLGALLAAAIGLLVALPVLRLRSVPHIAILTLALAEIIRIVCANLKDWTRGEMGLWGIPAPGGFRLPLLGHVVFNPVDKTGYYELAALLLIGTTAATLWFTRSRAGLALIAIREADGAAESLGINLARHKMRAFFLSALLVGLAGAFYAHYILLLTPSAVLGADLMVLVVAMTLVGGIGTIAGPILGAFLLTFGIESLRAIGDWRMLVYGALIMAVTLLRPLGLASIRWRRPRAVTPLPAPSPARDMPGP